MASKNSCAYTLLSGRKCKNPIYKHGVYCKLHHDKIFTQESNQLISVFKQLYTDIQGHLLTFIPYEYKDTFVEIIAQTSIKPKNVVKAFVDKRMFNLADYGEISYIYYHDVLRIEMISIKEGRLGGIYRKWHKINTPIDNLINYHNKNSWALKYVGKEQLQLERFFKDGRVHGPWREWDENGTLIYESMFHNGLLHGSFMSYSPTDKYMIIGTYQNGKMDGTVIEYLNGKIINKNSYTRGKCIYGEGWYENGKRKELYVKGIRNKVTITNWYEFGSLKSVNEYLVDRSGIITSHGDNTVWDEKGKILRKGYYHKGESIYLIAYIEEKNIYKFIEYKDGDILSCIELSENFDLQDEKLPSYYKLVMNSRN